ncbi:MAG: hypothetical protein H6616_00220 [Ignavibacteria bacterium]|nr:hypothetical protein [Ignavibacteria bacterium]
MGQSERGVSSGATTGGGSVRDHRWGSPFPTLYDDFFEAVREDFEHRLRRGLLEVARGLLARR